MSYTVLSLSAAVEQAGTVGTALANRIEVKGPYRHSSRDCNVNILKLSGIAGILFLLLACSSPDDSTRTQNSETSCSQIKARLATALGSIRSCQSDDDCSAFDLPYSLCYAPVNPDMITDKIDQLVELYRENCQTQSGNRSCSQSVPHTQCVSNRCGWAQQ